MNVHRIPGARPLAITAGAAAALAIGLAAAGPNPAGATQSPSARVANDTLTVTGTSRGDRIALRLAPGAPGTMQVDLNDDGIAEQSFDRNTFSRIEVFTRSGSDQFRVDQANGVIDEPATVSGGSGNDSLNGGDGIELFIGGSGNDAVDGNRGNDSAVLGSGRDSFRWDPGDGSDIVDGRSGTDTLDFNGAGVPENMSLSANGGRSLFLRDAGNIRMDMDGVERLDLTALGGPDTFTVEDMSGTDFRQADVDLSGPAGGGDGETDRVTVNGTDRSDRIDVETDGARVDVEGLRTELRITGSETRDALQVNSLGGNDDVDVEQAVFALIGVAVDLGSGQL
jgi:Ca2+-binding RTX toxin-like protein